MDATIKKVSSGLIWTYAERTIAQVVTLIVTIVLARLIAPADYGAIAIVTILITIADSFVVSGFGNALIQKKDADELDYSTVFYFSILFSMAIYLILFFCAPYIANHYEIPILDIVVKVMGLRLPIAAINSVQQAYVSKTMQFRKFFVSTIGGTVIAGASGIILAVCGYGIWALVAQYLGGVVIGTIVLFFTSGWKPKLIYSQKRMNKLFSFGWKIMAVGVMTSVYSNMRNFVIGDKYTTEELAYSTKGEQFPSTIAGNINSSITKVLYPVLSSKQDDLCVIKNIMRRSINVGNYILAPILLGLAAVAEPFVSLLLTDEWIECVPYLQIMCVVYALQPIQTSSLQVVKALGKGNLYLIIDVIKKLFGVIVLLITVFCFDSVLVIIWGALITEVFCTLVNVPINKRLIKYGYREQALDILKPIVYTGTMIVAIKLFALIPMNRIVSFILQIMIGVIVYLLLSVLTKDKTFYYVKDIVKSLLKKEKSEGER